jgi:hypothetical protein
VDRKDGAACLMADLPARAVFRLVHANVPRLVGGRHGNKAIPEPSGGFWEAYKNRRGLARSIPIILIPLKGKGPSYCCSAANDIRAFQWALEIAGGLQRISCERSLHNMKGRTGSPTSCSRIFLTGHGRKLSPKPNWNVASNILGCQRPLRRGDSARNLSRVRVGG